MIKRTQLMIYCLLPSPPLSLPHLDLSTCLPLLLRSPHFFFKLFGVKCTSFPPLLPLIGFQRDRMKCSEAGMCFCDPYSSTEMYMQEERKRQSCWLARVLLSVRSTCFQNCLLLLFLSSPSTSILLTCTFPTSFLSIFQCSRKFYPAGSVLTNFWQ